MKAPSKSQKALIERILSDLNDIREAISQQENNDQTVPTAGLAYLIANQHILTFFVDQLYESVSLSDREKLFERYGELDYSVIETSFRDIAKTAIRKVTIGKAGLDMGLILVKDDDIHMLVRALRYVAYYKLENRNYELKRSPIIQHGLELYRPEESTLSANHLHKISWYISDGLYAEEKSKAIEICRAMGLELQEPRERPRAFDYVQAVENGRKILVELLKNKLEHDIGLAKIQSSLEWDKYIPYIRDRFREEYLNLYKKYHGGLMHLAKQFNNSETELRVIDSLQAHHDARPFLKQRVALEKKIHEICPKGETLRKLQDSLPKQEVKIMGDVFNNIQDSTIISKSNVDGWTQNKNQIDLSQLAKELAELRAAMRRKADSSEQDMAVGKIASAEEAAKMNNGPSVLQHLKDAGKWALDVAKEIGAKLTVEVLKDTLGLKK